MVEEVKEITSKEKKFSLPKIVSVPELVPVVVD
jgi:hypothetical protein